MNKNLPDGVTARMIDEAMGGPYPPACDNCEYDECPFGGKFEFCPKVDVIEKCRRCGARIQLVPGLVKYVVYFYDTIYLCSEKCQREEQVDVDNEIAVLKGEAERTDL